VVGRPFNSRSKTEMRSQRLINVFRITFIFGRALSIQIEGIPCGRIEVWRAGSRKDSLPLPNECHDRPKLIVVAAGLCDPGHGPAVGAPGIVTRGFFQEPEEGRRSEEKVVMHQPAFPHGNTQYVATTIDDGSDECILCSEI
jgi:hypothetical protein